MKLILCLTICLTAATLLGCNCNRPYGTPRNPSPYSLNPDQPAPNDLTTINPDWNAAEIRIHTQTRIQNDT